MTKILFLTGTPPPLCHIEKKRSYSSAQGGSYYCPKAHLVGVYGLGSNLNQQHVFEMPYQLIDMIVIFLKIEFLDLVAYL